MLIFGTKVTKPVVAAGEFFCPECRKLQPYQVIAPKKWGHLYFIPVLPLQEFDRHVECKGCKTAFREEILSIDSKPLIEANTPAPPREQVFVFDCRQEIDLAISVTNFIKSLLEDQRGMTMFAGAVFALQQDLKLAMGVNLWDATNLYRDAIEEHGIRLPGTNVRRSARDAAKLAIDIHAMMAMNANFVQDYRDKFRHAPPDHLTAEQLEALAVAAGIRNKAAALWLLTIMPCEEDNSMVRLGATNAWMMLCMVRVEELLPPARAMVGGHFNDIACRDFSTGDWPDILA
jgi:hypothetical protein